MKKLSIILLFIIASTIYAQASDFIPYPATDFSKDTAYPVLSVIDGDTVNITYKGKKRSVRLIGVDTPETVHPSKPIEPYGKEAAAFLKNLLKEESVYLRFDREKIDRYNRLLAYLYRAPDGLFVNLEIIRQGYGRAYTEYPFKLMALFQHYGTRAQKTGKGLYGVEATSTIGKAEATVETPSDSQQKTVTVYVTQTGSKYHNAGCTYLRGSKIPISLGAAKARYSPCSRCGLQSLLNEELRKLPVTNPNLRLDKVWLSRIYPNANKVSTTKVSSENQSSSKPEVSSSKYPACKVCGGGSVITKYGKKSHSSTCRYVRNTKYPTRSSSSYSSGTVRVKGYYRKDGTYVRPHTRRKPRK